MRDIAAVVSSLLAAGGLLVVLATLVPSLLPTSIIAEPWRRRSRLTLAFATVWTIAFLATALATLPPASGGDEEVAATTTSTSIATTTTTTPTSTSATTSTATTSTTVSAVTTSTHALMPGAELAIVTTVTDGDTLDVRLADGTTDTVRLIGINAPEGGECFAAEATAALTLLVKGSDVQLTSDISDRDQFGRLLRYAWTLDGEMVNELLVADGAAIAREYPPDTAHAQRLAAAQDRAMAARVGLWAPDVCGTRATADVGFSGAIFDAPGDDLDPITGERVSITNRGDDAIDLTDWSLADESASHRYTFPTGFTLGAGLTVTVYTACGTDSAEFLYWCEQGSAVWNNDGDTAFLRDPNGNVVDTTDEGGSPPQHTPTTTTTTTGTPTTAEANCDPSYPDVCIPPYPPDLDCGDIPYRRFRVVGSDPHGFDGDNDGIGCES